MKKEFILIVLAGLLIIPAFSQHPPLDKNWEMVFVDNFSTFNTRIWHKEYGAHNAGEGDKESIHFCTYDNVYIENGKLVLRAQKQISQCIPNNGKPCRYNGYHMYTSGAINSNILYKYGYFEINAKLPGSTGYFPAFWLIGGNENLVTNNCWYNEIDIFEAYGDRTGEVESRAHSYIKCPMVDEVDRTEKERHAVNYATGYHWYGLEWNRDKITWYIDRKIVRQIPNDKSIDNVYIQNPMFIVINVGLNSATTGDNLISSSTIFPNYMYVDQANVWKLIYDCGTVVNEIQDYNTFYAVRKSISLSGLSSLSLGENVSLRATDFIELKAGFEVPIGAELYLDINPCE